MLPIPRCSLAIVSILWWIPLFATAYVLPADEEFGVDVHNTSSTTPRTLEDGTSLEIALSKLPSSSSSSLSIATSDGTGGPSTEALEWFRQHCRMDDVDEWWPLASRQHWMTRTPNFMILGAKKAGTTTLNSWVHDHPSIVKPRTKELLFFIPKRFQNYMIGSKKANPEHYRWGGLVDVDSAREDAYNEDYRAIKLQHSPNQITFEATPGYLFYSTFAKNSILCTFPWVKFIVLLRHPIDRIYSEFNFLVDPRKPRLKKQRQMLLKKGIDGWIAHDLLQLRRAGVLQNKIPQHEFFGSAAERQAWTRYQDGLDNSISSPLGRSLYALQLEEWYDGLRQLGRNPETELLAIRSEEMKTDPDGVYNKVLWWLGLSTDHLPAYDSRMKTTYSTPPMSNETRALLMKFFKPYNERLYKLLGQDWEGVFDTPSAHSNNHNKNNSTDVNYDDDGVGDLEAEEDLNGDDGEEEAMLETMDSSHHVFDPPNYDEDKGIEFTDKWCVLDKISWYPPPHKDWQLRAPYFILPGAKKSGTTSLSYYIAQHPLVEKARTKELQFFLNKNFRMDYVTSDRKTLVKQARDHMYEFEYHSKVLRYNKSLISMDATPGYLFFSDMLPQRILCVAPWIKLVVILRNPIDRMHSNYQFVIEYHGAKKLPLAQVIHADLQPLMRSGFLNATNPQDEAASWRQYLTEAREGFVGRSMYEIQLRQWFQAFRDVGRDPATQICIVRLEDLHDNLQGTMEKVFTFLNLPPILIEHEEVKVSSHKDPIDPVLRKKLEEFFQPHNEKLYKLLMENGFGEDWDGYWEKRQTAGRRRRERKR